MISSQKKLTRSLIALAVSGSLIISLLWWDSTRFECMWDSNVLMLQSDYSEILIAWPETSSASPYSEFYRKRGNSPTPRIALPFSKARMGIQVRDHPHLPSPPHLPRRPPPRLAPTHEPPRPAGSQKGAVDFKDVAFSVQWKVSPCRPNPISQDR